MRVLLVANPRSGKGKTKKYMPRIAAGLRKRGASVDILVTRRAGEARDQARARGGEFDVIVVAGGDGTVNEVVNGLAGAEARAEAGAKPPILPLRLGTSNSLARELSIPRSPDEAAALIEEGRKRALDLGEVRWPDGRRRLFFLCAGAGLDAWAVHRLARARAGGTSFAQWTLRAAEGFLRYRFPPIDVSIEGLELVPARTVVVANLRTFGGPLVMADGASPEDGKLDVVCMRGESRPELLRFLWACWRARVSSTRGAEILRCDEVELGGEGVPFELDGEPAGVLPVGIRVRPGAALFLSP